MPKRSLNPEIIQAAIRGFEAQQEQIDKQISELRSVLSARGGKSSAPPVKKATARGTISAEGRARIAAAQRKRWAARKKAK